MRTVFALAAWAAGCGGRSAPNDDLGAALVADAGDCPVATAGPDPVANCAAYCAYLACSACPGSVDDCISLCGAAESNGMLNEACLACAIDNESAVGQQVSCESFASPGEDGGAVFTLTYSIAACASACTHAP